MPDLNMRPMIDGLKKIVKDELGQLVEGAEELLPLVQDIGTKLARAAAYDRPDLVEELQDQLLLLRQEGRLIALDGKEDLLDAFIDRGMFAIMRAARAGLAAR